MGALPTTLYTFMRHLLRPVTFLVLLVLWPFIEAVQTVIARRRRKLRGFPGAPIGPAWPPVLSFQSSALWGNASTTVCL
eukprot:gene6579-biopygen9676